MILVPDYYKKFGCIADECTDSCCIGWEIDVDAETIAKYRGMENSGEFLEKLDLASDPPHIRLCEGEKCPFLDEHGLCRIISKYGEEYIPEICKKHPRYINETSAYTECALGLACPESARIVLEIADRPRLEIWDENATYTPVLKKSRDKFPTTYNKNEDLTENTPTNAENALFLLREKIFDLIFDKNHTVGEIISGLFVCDAAVSDYAFDLFAGISTKSPEIKVADFGDISPLISLLPSAIQSLELLGEDYRRGFATPSAELIAERLMLLGERARAMLYYFVHRYFLAGVMDMDVDARLSFAVMLLMLYLLHMDDPSVSGARDAAVAFSKNVEYSTENIEILLGIIAEKP